MILADTSVWVDHFRRSDPRLTASLEWADVVMHPFVLGEIACGHVRDRLEVLGLLGDLPSAPVATDAEAMAFLESRNLMGRGVGWVDIHLLASAALGGLELWTRDRRLADVARELGFSV